MNYLGGKFRVAKYIVPILESFRDNEPFVEPFVGGANIISRMSGLKYGYDICEPLIVLYNSLLNGWIPPENVSEEEYNYYKENKDQLLNDPMVAFCGFGCSWGAKWFGGYARDNTTRNYAKNAKNSLLKKFKNLSKENTFFNCLSYDKLELNNSLVYCDPPYKGTTQYDYNKNFDHNKFWNTMREWSKTNIVIISEYNAPNDFICFREFVTKTDLCTKNGKDKRIEKLFIHKDI